MPHINCLPDDVLLESQSTDTILKSLLANDIDHTHICGGKAYCSTCRIMILAGINNCSPPTAAERALAKKLNFPIHVRLACQTKISGDVKIRRMVTDTEDIDIVAEQLESNSIAYDRPVTLVLASICSVTDFDEVNFHYDVLYIMTRYFHKMQKIVKQYDGMITNVMGLKLLAIFSKDDPTTATTKAVWAGLEMLKAVDELNNYLEKLSYRPLHLSIGIHHGPTILVPVEFGKPDAFTPLGDVVNLVSQVEAANLEIGSALLATQAVYHLIQNQVVVGRTGNLRTTPRHSIDLYEITKIHGDRPTSLVKEASNKKHKIFSFIERFSKSWFGF